MKVKVCGITRREDALLAVDLGASALGFVFWPGSPRAVTADAVRRIVSAVPAFVTTVGVFVNDAPAHVLATAARAGVTAVQLHGDEEAAEYVGGPLPVIKAVAVQDGFSPRMLERVPNGVTVLLDAHDPVRRGGTGRTVDWAVAAAAARVRPVILSGGLTPDNVRGAAATVRPYAVDVSSGVESAPGVKDESKLRAFFSALQS